MSEKKPRTRRKTNSKTKSAPTNTLFSHFGKQLAATVEPEPKPTTEPTEKPVSKPPYNARIVSRTSSYQGGSTTPLIGKRRRGTSDSPPVTPARLRSRSPLVLPSSSPPQQRSSSPVILSSSPPPPSSGTPSRVTSPPPRPITPVVVLSSSSPMVLARSPMIIVDDESPLSSPPSPPRTFDDEKTDSDGLGLTKHPFFANARSKAKPKAKSAPSNGKGKLKPSGSQEAPIEIGGEDEQQSRSGSKITSAAVHAFFKPRKAAVVLSETQEGKVKFKGGVDPPWPTLDSIHAGRSTESIAEKACPVPRRRVVASETSVSDEATRAWADMYRRSQEDDDILDLSTTQIDAWSDLRHPRDDGTGIPEEHAKDPAIARFNNPGRAFGPPMKSEEMLGNGTEVRLIKEWLGKLALKRKEDEEREIQEAIEAQQKVNEEKEEVQEPGKKRKKEKKEKAPVVIKRDTIVRNVAKSKKRAKENQDEYDPGMIDDFLDDGDEDPVRIEYNALGITLVVCGGPGSGKSAAIHACAQELGWTVFEIYPGIGKRGIGANGLAGWVGDAGMNHLVNGKANKEEISQSVILLDQVDMWFEQDALYWSAIQNLVSDSRRGVIMTTNDMYSFADVFPVHMYYELDHVDPDLASSYLYAQARAALLAQAGGAETEADVLRRLPSRQAFRELYLKTAITPRLPSYAIQDIPVHPHPSQMDRLRELGRALEEVKFWVIHGRNCQEREDRVALDVREAWDACGYDVVESLGDWSQSKVVKQPGKAGAVEAMRLGRFADTFSWIDAHLERRWSRQHEAAEVDRFAPGPDDQTYYKMVELCKPSRQESFGIAEYCADADIALSALCLARRRLERGGAGGSARLGLKNPSHWNARWLEEERSEYQDRVLTYLERYILSEATPQLPRPAVVLDVLPVVHRIVEVDNEFEKEAEKGPVRAERAGRPRRAAAQAQNKQGYVRYLTLHTPDKQAKALALVKETEYKLM